jgi:hypothetical protein
MLEAHLPIKKYQRVATIAAAIGFILGVLTPVIFISTGEWSCPFGSSAIGVGGFILLTGVISAALIGNGVALLVILALKWRQSTSASSRRGKNEYE